MTVEQIEERLVTLEKRVRELEEARDDDRDPKRFLRTFGMFADDEEFDEVVRLGREYRESS